VLEQEFGVLINGAQCRQYCDHITYRTCSRSAQIGIVYYQGFWPLFAFKSFEMVFALEGFTVTYNISIDVLEVEFHL